MLFDVDKNKYVMQIDSTDRLINKIPKIEAHLKGLYNKWLGKKNRAYEKI